jgi:hypothetical protein
MIILVPDNCRMNDVKIGYRTANIQDGAIHGIREHNFPWLELTTRNQNGCSNPSRENWNLNQTPSWRNLC